MNRDDVQEVVGFDNDVKSLKELLLRRDHPQKMFISILGESGVGKNTLVKKICNDPEVDEHFRVLIWYNMPPDCSTEDLLKQIYELVYKQSEEHGACSQEEGNNIPGQLRGLLHKKRYLLILNGISSKTMLNCVSASLADDENGSRVVLICEPESKDVACHAAILNLNTKGVKSIHKLSRLDEERSGRLFRLRVFGSEQEEMKGTKETEEIEEIEEMEDSAKEKELEAAKEIKRYEKDVYDITGGHPLAIVVLAGLLPVRNDVIEVHDRNDVSPSASVRRLSIQNDSGSYTTFTNNFSKLRSFIWHVEKQGQSSDRASKKKQQLGYHDLKFLCASKFLRVLSVKGLTLQELPCEIGDMIHLRYLCIDSADLKKLPSSIRKLLNLQTLDISNTKVEEIDQKFWLIEALRHVLGKSLTLPASVVEELVELQTLHGVKPVQGKWHEGSCPLDKMTKLRSLDMHGFEYDVHGAALKSALGKMHLLGHLKLQGDKIPSCVFTEPISLRRLETMVLDGTVKWPEIEATDLRKVRPNLIALKLKEIGDVPRTITDELEKMNVEIEEIEPEILPFE